MQPGSAGAVETEPAKQHHADDGVDPGQGIATAPALASSSPPLRNRLPPCLAHTKWRIEMPPYRTRWTSATLEGDPAIAPFVCAERPVGRGSLPTPPPPFGGSRR